MPNQFLNVPLSMPDQAQHLRLVSTTLNNVMDGKINSTGEITLRASQTTTTLEDARIGGDSVIVFMPITANGKTAENDLFVSARQSGQATLTHASSGNTDQNFAYIIVG
tara:strand:- start:941 stop:1267 length:327 start_codon:yes stop_codon:yes gene_type:complete